MLDLRSSVTKRIGGLLRSLCIVLFSFSVTCGVFANPVLNNVSSGNVSIQQAPDSTVINQNSQQAIINWQSFNINANERTHFQQPTGGVALNRISPTQGGSQIYGTLTATGQIILINPAGIYFGAGAYVNVGGLIATTRNITDQNFLNGIYKFNKVDGYDGAIINKGTIIAANNGLIALVGAGVENDGTIQANLGKVVLASGDAFTMNFAGNELINFTIDAKTSSAGRDPQGNKLRNGVSNTGSIIANGGKVIVTAQAAAGVLDNVINMQGITQARSVGQKDGVIIISGDNDAGVVTIDGKLDASGKNSGEKGGNIDITGHNILLDSQTDIDISGDVGGGNLNVGGGYQGQGPLEHSNATVLASGAKVNANAITQGNGGNIVLWSDNVTKAYGSVSAQGGAYGGDGGNVETSSLGYLDVNGFNVNLLAANGRTGNWLLDPANITICANCTTTTNLSTGTFSPGTDNSLLLYTDLQTQLASANITVLTSGSAYSGSGFGDINVNTDITWSSANSLTLSAFRSININADLISTGASTLNLLTNNNVGGTSSGGALNFNGGSIQLTNAGSALNIDGNAYTLIRDQTSLQGLTTGYAALAMNLNASGWTGFTPIVLGGSIQLNGLGNAISNLSYTSAATSVGLFGGIFGGEIKNLGLIGGTITATNGSAVVGPFAGDNTGTISNVFSTVSVVGTGATGTVGSLGGLVGLNRSQITNSYANASITGTSVYKVGGLVGNNTGNINNSYSMGTVNTGSAVGGLVGTNGPSGSITNSLAMSAVSNGGNIGGLVGSNSGSVTNSYWNTSTSGIGTSPAGTGLTTAQLQSALPTGFSNSIWGNGNNLATPYLLSNPGPTYVAGAGTTVYTALTSINQLQAALSSNLGGNFILGTNIVATGFNFTPVGNNVTPFTGVLNGANFAINDLYINSAGIYSGLIGFTSAAAIISNLGLNNLSISGSSVNVGGIVGWNLGSITNSYASGTISTTSTSGLLGGLIGRNAGAISTSYANVNLSGAAFNVGGFVGLNAAGGTITDAYALGSVTSSTATGFGGGFAGANNANITRVYSTGPANATRVRGFIGNNTGTILNSFWDTTTSNNGTSNFANSGTLGVTAGCLSGTCPNGGTANLSLLATYTGAGWSMTSTPGTTSAPANTWFLFAGMRPMLMMENNLNVTNGHQLQMVGARLAGNYTMGSNIDLTTSLATARDVWGGLSTGFLPIGIDTTPFTGSFNGSTYTITGLNINRTSPFIGLFGYTSGTSALSNIKLNNATITSNTNNANTYVGALVGQNLGSITNSYANVILNGASTINSMSAYLGGLVGWNSGTISNSFTTGSVSGTYTLASNNIYMGGLVATNAGTISSSYSNAVMSGNTGTTFLSIGGFVGDNTGTITNAYATGAVTGTSSYSGSGGGGFFGFNDATGLISNTFSTGATNGQFVRGFGGRNVGSTIQNSFWDTDTSGTNAGLYGDSGTTNLIGGCLTGVCATGGTANLSALSTYAAWNISANPGVGSIWSLIPGQSYPYLTAFYSGTPQAVSGNTPSANATVSLATAGSVVKTITTGANGFYYFLSGNNLISGVNDALATGSAILTYLSSGATLGNAVTLLPSANNGTVSGTNSLDILANTLNVGTTNAINIQLTDISTALGALSGNPNIVFGITGNTLSLLNNANLITTAATNLNLVGNTVVTSGSGNITFNGMVNGANTLTLTTGGIKTLAGIVGGTVALTGLTLNGAGNNAINTTAITTTGDQAYSNATTLGANAILNAGTGAITFSGTIDGGNSLTLTSSGAKTLGGIVGGSTALTSLTLNGGGTSILNGTAITTTGNQLFTDATTLGTSVALNSSAGNINFSSTVNGGSTSNTLTINSAGSTSAVTGNITNLGKLIKGGAGTLTLSGTNAYGNLTADTTTINAGILAVNNDNNLGTINALNGITFNGGTLKILSSGFSSGRNIALASGGGTIDTFGNDSTFSGVISGTGALTLNDSGTTNPNFGGSITSFTGNNTYSGGTNILSGTFGIGNNGALGSGAITIGGTGNAGIRAVSAARSVNNVLNLNASFALGRLTTFTGNALLGNNITIANVNPDAASNGASGFSGIISDGGNGYGITITTDAKGFGTGSIILSGNNTYSGGTTVSGFNASTPGVLGIGSVNALGTGTLTLNGGSIYGNNVTVNNSYIVTGNSSITGTASNS
ncbi:MAG: filamentous hemagglutinin N-terminal domain-containing protein, partial [Gammaproteobacteria bacterium]